MAALRSLTRRCVRAPFSVTSASAWQPRQLRFAATSGSRILDQTQKRPQAGPENSYISLGQSDGMEGNQAQMAMGIAYLEQALEVQQQEYDAADAQRKPQALYSLTGLHLNLGKQHHQAGNGAAASEHYIEAVSLINGMELPETAKSRIKASQFMLSEAYSGLGVVKREAGDTDEALKLLQSSLKLRRMAVGKQHASVAECLNNIAAIHFERGAYSRAAENYEEALTILTQIFQGEENRFVALTFYNLGLCWTKLEYPQAHTALEKALEIAGSAFGPTHETTLSIRDTLVKSHPAFKMAGSTGPDA